MSDTRVGLVSKLRYCEIVDRGESGEICVSLVKREIASCISYRVGNNY